MNWFILWYGVGYFLAMALIFADFRSRNEEDFTVKCFFELLIVSCFSWFWIMLMLWDKIKDIVIFKMVK